MPRASVKQFRIPEAPARIEAGASLKDLLDVGAIECLAANLAIVAPGFDRLGFRRAALEGIEPLSLMERGPHIARALRPFLPERFEAALQVLLASLTPPLTATEGNGLAVFFYHPHASFIAAYGLDPQHNNGRDGFDAALHGLYELTQRFTAEFAIRPFLQQQPERTLARLTTWLADPNPHVRRLCSEGPRPRLPWASRLPALIADPTPTLPLLEALKNDPSLYVRRSVANHLGDIAKDHPDRMFKLCERWLPHASPEVRWVIRHALRHPAKQGDPTALRLRTAAK
jgi:3-methyladenine DNA glycosylase AlkC